MSGKVGDNVYRASGVIAAAAGGAVEWCSTVKTSAFCAAAGSGYFVNTCGGGVTVTLPSTASAGDEINFTDYARTWATACKELTLDQGSLKFQGQTCPNPEYDTEGATVKIVYSGATQGWLPQLDKGTDDEVPQAYNVQYLVVAGGGGGAGMKTGTGDTISEGGGGAGGMRVVATKSFSVTKCASIPITVGGGGTAGDGGPGNTSGTSGCSSIFSTITSAGGGYGGSGSGPAPCLPGADGGSGGGAGRGKDAGSGNTPAIPAPLGGPQGNDGGGPGGSPTIGGGGGGHTAVGADGPGGAGGAGTADDIIESGTDVTYATGGTGGAASPGTPGTAGPANSGNGGGSGKAAGPGSALGGAGGPGIVVIRRLTSSSCTTSGTNTTCGSDTIHTFTGPGTFVA